MRRRGRPGGGHGRRWRRRACRRAPARSERRVGAVAGRGVRVWPETAKKLESPAACLPPPVLAMVCLVGQVVHLSGAWTVSDLPVEMCGPLTPESGRLAGESSFFYMDGNSAVLTSEISWPNLVQTERMIP
jgi:hypothetical protein